MSKVSVRSNETIILGYLAPIVGSDGMSAVSLKSLDVSTGGAFVHVVVSDGLSHRGTK